MSSSSVLKKCVLAVFLGLTRRVAKYRRSVVYSTHTHTHRLHSASHTVLASGQGYRAITLSCPDHTELLTASRYFWCLGYSTGSVPLINCC